jgi:hypothetical protein
VRPFAGPGTQIPISTSGGEWPKWSSTRSEIVYLAPDRRIMIVSYSVTGGSFHADQPRPWPEAKLEGRGGGHEFDLHPDGERLALPAVAGPAPAPTWERVELMLNAFDEFRRIAPAQTR